MQLFSPRFLPRFSLRCMALRGVALCGLLLAAPARADAPEARIAALLHSERLFAILAREAEDYGSDLAGEFLGAQDAGWAEEVRVIHAPARMQAEFETVLAAELAGDPLPEIEAFLASPTGQRMIGLELSAREALLDPGVEAAAEAALEAAEAAQDPRLAQVRAVIEAADLVEENVAGGLNTNFAFTAALAAGDGFAYPVTEAEILADLAAGEPDLRADVTLWLESFLLMAYAPASEAELAQWLAFARSEPGQALIHAQFAGFDRVFEGSSTALGAALARRLAATEL
jgi:hypothetical protein